MHEDCEHCTLLLLLTHELVTTVYTLFAMCKLESESTAQQAAYGQHHVHELGNIFWQQLWPINLEILQEHLVIP